MRIFRKTYWKASLLAQRKYAIIATDIHNRIIIWNKGAELIYGYSKEEMLGKQFPPDLHRKGLPNNEFLFVPNNETKSRLIDQTMYAKRKDGTFIPFPLPQPPESTKTTKHWLIDSYQRYYKIQAFGPIQQCTD